MEEKAISQLEQLVAMMGIDEHTIESRVGEEGKTILNIIDLNDRDTALLIGKQGESLQALQLILRTMLRAQDDEQMREEKHLTVDVMFYRRRQEDHLVILAKRQAEEAKLSDREIELRPMNAYERRIIHMTLKEIPGIATESIGNDPDRRILIKPVKAEMVDMDL